MNKVVIIVIANFKILNNLVIVQILFNKMINKPQKKQIKIRFKKSINNNFRNHNKKHKINKIKI